MAVKLLRCGASECRHEFEAEPKDAACPECGSETVREIARVHYVYVEKSGPIATQNGRRTIACDPRCKKLPKHASGHRASVTCPACKAAAVYAEHEEAGVRNHVPVIEKVAVEKLRQKLSRAE
jgi:Zn finger protein HypA/HybF involved in hydrogenase expression